MLRDYRTDVYIADVADEADREDQHQPGIRRAARVVARRQPRSRLVSEPRDGQADRRRHAALEHRTSAT